MRRVRGGFYSRNFFLGFGNKRGAEPVFHGSNSGADRASGDISRNQRFEELVLPYLPAAYELARWLCGNDHDAEDVVQESYMRAFRYFDDWRGENARAWLLTIVRNTAFSWLEQNRPKHVVGMAPDSLAATGESTCFGCDGHAANPERAALAVEERAQLQAALEALPAIFREVIVLRELHDLSYREIAEVTGVPEGTVMSRLARARAELRRVWLKHTP
jgi:RNA polymerase sigma-70 factor, ECF subfamily